VCARVLCLLCVVIKVCYLRTRAPGQLPAGRRVVGSPVATPAAIRPTHEHTPQCKRGTGRSVAPVRPSREPARQAAGQRHGPSAAAAAHAALHRVGGAPATHQVLDFHVLVRQVRDGVRRPPCRARPAGLRVLGRREVVLREQADQGRQRVLRRDFGLVLGLDSQQAQDEGGLLLHVLVLGAAVRVVVGKWGVGRATTGVAASAASWGNAEGEGCLRAPACARTL